MNCQRFLQFIFLFHTLVSWLCSLKLLFITQREIQALTIPFITYVQFKTVSKISVILAGSGHSSVQLIITSPTKQSQNTRLQKGSCLLQLCHRNTYIITHASSDFSDAQQHDSFVLLISLDNQQNRNQTIAKTRHQYHTQGIQHHCYNTLRNL